MFQMKSEIHRHIQQRFRLSMVFIRELATLELKRLIRRQKRNFRHCANYTGRNKKHSAPKVP